MCKELGIFPIVLTFHVSAIPRSKKKGGHFLRVVSQLVYSVPHSSISYFWHYVSVLQYNSTVKYGNNVGIGGRCWRVNWWPPGGRWLQALLKERDRGCRESNMSSQEMQLHLPAILKAHSLQLILLCVCVWGGCICMLAFVCVRRCIAFCVP